MLPQYMKEAFQKRLEHDQFDGISQAVERVEFDPIDERMENASIANMRSAALSVVFQTALILNEGQDDDEALLPNELLDSLTLEAIDADDDEVNPVLKATLSAHIADGFSSLGVSDDVIEDLFHSDQEIADSAIENACEVVVENLPDDGEPLDEFIKWFVYGYGLYEDEDGAFDSAKPKKKLKVGQKTAKKINGHTIQYKAVKAVRDGKIVTVNKRISGNIVLTSAQKSALRKARKKSTTVTALRKQMKSLNKGISRDIYKNMTEAQKKRLKKRKFSSS